MKKLDLAGKTFNRLTVTSENTTKDRVAWNCICSCGNHHIATTQVLRRGSSQSCGCLKQEVKTTQGGLSTNPLYNTWYSMKSRCYDSNNKRFRDYGGRGIKVCDRWFNSIENFIDDMGYKPTSNHSIDRIDNNSDYSPSNCKWSDHIEQNNNKRMNHNLTLNNKTLTVSQWARLLNIPTSTIYTRIRRGLDADKALAKNHIR